MNFNQFFSSGFGGPRFSFSGMPRGIPRQAPLSQQNTDSSRLYKILNISKDATPTDIKKAYRRASMKGDYRHPDRGGDNSKFQQLQKAYEILSDESKRKMWDKYGEQSLEEGFVDPATMGNIGGLGGMFGFGRSTQKQTLQKGPTKQMTLDITLTELCQNTEKKFTVQKPTIINKKTRKIIDNLQSVYETCSKCKGVGQITQMIQIGPGMIQQSSQPCDCCKGTGYQLHNAYSVETRNEDITLFIEKGSKDGDKIKIRDKGLFSIGQLPGDIVIVLQETKHPDYYRKNADLLRKHTISLQDALCGTTCRFIHPDGRILEFTHKQVITHDSLFTLEGQGMPIKGDSSACGDLFIQFHIQYPQQKEITTNIRQQLQIIFSNMPSFQLLQYQSNQQFQTVSPEQIEQVELQQSTIHNYGKDTETKSGNSATHESDDEDEPHHNPNECPIH